MLESNKSEKVQYNSVRNIANQYYTIDLLQEMIPTYFIPWAEKGYIKDSQNALKDLKSSFYTKELLLDIFTQFVLDKEFFEKAYNDMPEVVKEVFVEAVWNGGGDIETLYKKYRVNIKNPAPGSKGRVLQPEFRMFKTDIMFKGMQVGTITIDERLIPFLKRVVPKPYGAELHKVEEFKGKYVANYEKEVIENFEAYLEMKRSGDTKVSGAGKPLKNSMMKFERYAKISEFYPETTEIGLKDLKKELIIKIMDGYRIDIIKEKNNPVEMLKEFLNRMFTGEGFVEKVYGYKQVTMSLVKILHPNLKGIRKDEENLELYLSAFKKLLMDMGRFSWLSIDNICEYIYYNDIPPTPYPIGYIHYYLKIEDKFSGGVNDIYFRDYNSVFNYLVKPIVQGMMFIMSVFGVIEIAYDTPEKTKEITTSDGYLSCFSHAKYVKITDFGKYVLNMTKEYSEFKENDEKMTIELSESELLITTKGEDKLKKILIAKMANQIADGIYKVTYQSVFSECSTTADVRNKIADFKKRIAGKLPENWVKFFEMVEGKLIPIEPITEMLVYKLKEEPELISIVAKNEEIKKLIFKAEGYHILVEKKNLNKLKKALAENGYFSD